MGQIDFKISNCLTQPQRYSMSIFDALNAKLLSVKHVAVFFWDTRYYVYTMYMLCVYYVLKNFHVYSNNKQCMSVKTYKNMVDCNPAI